MSSENQSLNHTFPLTYILKYRVGQSRFTVVSAGNSLFFLLFIIYCIIFHMNNCKLTFAPPSSRNRIQTFKMWKLSRITMNEYQTIIDL